MADRIWMTMSVRWQFRRKNRAVFKLSLNRVALKHTTRHDMRREMEEERERESYGVEYACDGDIAKDVKRARQRPESRGQSEGGEVGAVGQEGLEADGLPHTGLRHEWHHRDAHIRLEEDVDVGDVEGATVHTNHLRVLLHDGQHLFRRFNNTTSTSLFLKKYPPKGSLPI